MWWDLPRYYFVLPFVFLFGSCVGSFLNVCIHRFPAHPGLREQLRSLNRHRSGCPRCLSSILWRDNIPLLGWLLLRGRCRTCGKPISIRYPVVELLTAVLFVVMYQLEMPANFWSPPEDFGLYYVDGPQRIEGLWAAPVWLHVRYLLHLALICCLIVATFIDMELKIIPDGCTLPLMLVAPLAAAICGQAWIVPLWSQDDSVVEVLRTILPETARPLLFSWDCLPFAKQHPHWHGFLVSLAGILVGGGAVWIVRVVGVCMLRQEAMGFGDVTLMAMVGSVLGWQLSLVVFVLAPMLAILAALSTWLLKRQQEFPYGPWLACGTLALLLGWPIVWPRADRVFDMGPLIPLMAVFMIVSLAGSLQLVRIVKTLLGAAPPEFPMGFSDLEEVRLLRRWLRLPVHDRMIAPPDGWTSADHLTYYNSERPDVQVSQWPREIWPGVRAGQGLAPYHSWKSGRQG
jgi:leader peptidase (prepilin peptidase) / N-methyltransferase